MSERNEDRKRGARLILIVLRPDPIYGEAH
jgi:hypothetical protein